MKLKKGLIKDILILVVPVLILLLLTPILPDRIPIHKGLNNEYIDKKYAFLLGVLPFAVYKIKYGRK